MDNRNALQRTLSSNWFYLGLLAFLILFPHIIGWITGDSPFGIRGRQIGQSVFWQFIMIEVFILAVLTMSYNLIFGFTGVISLGHAMFFGLGGYIIGMALEYTELAAIPALALGIVMGVIITGLLGFVTSLVTLRLRGVYFAIFTLALAEMVAIYIGRWPVTNAEDGFNITNLPEILNSSRNRLFFYYMALVFVVIVFLFIRRVMNSPTGRVLLAVRENEERAKTIGFNTLQFKMLSITMAGIIAAGAGMMHVVLVKKVGPEILSVNYTIDPLLMTIIGGVGTLAGPIIGTAGLHLSERIFNREFEVLGTTLNIGEYWSLILGAIFILVVLVFPKGIVGTWTDWRAKRRQPVKKSEMSRAPAAGD